MACRLVPTIANVDAQGNWAYPPVARILHNPVPDERGAFAAIVALADSGPFAGIDIDFQNLQAGDRQDFTAFVTRLAGALHAQGKILSVALFAKATDAGYAPRKPGAGLRGHRQGRRPGAADGLRLPLVHLAARAHSSGQLGPLGASATRGRRSRPAGSCWGSRCTGTTGPAVTPPDLTGQQAEQLAAQHGATVHYDTASQSPWFSYADSSGRTHDVWFEDPQSSAAKFALVRQLGLGGMFLWMYGDEAPGTWPQLHRSPRIRRRAGRAQSQRAAMMPWWSAAVLVFGLNFALWGTVGLCRLLDAGAGRLSRWRFARRFAGLREVRYTGDAYPRPGLDPGGARPAPDHGPPGPAARAPGGRRRGPHPGA